MALFGFDIVRTDRFFTFAALEDAPTHTFAGSTYLGAAATINYEGEPWEIMRENELVYDFANDEVVAIDSLTQKVTISQSSEYYFSNGLLMPGSMNSEGERVSDYSGWYNFQIGQFSYSEISYV